MSNTYKIACQTLQKKCLTLGVGSAIILSSLMMPQIASAATTASFTVSGELNNGATNNPIFYGANFSGTFEIALDTHSIVPYTTTVKYDLTNWEVLFTANSGESFEFSQDELGDSANIYLVDFNTPVLSDRVTINFTEDNGSDADSFLQFSFKTNYDIVNSTTLTELLNGDPEVGTVDTFLSGTMAFSKGSDLTHLNSVSFSSAEETVSPVPEASTLAMLGLGSLMVFGLARRNRKSPSVQTA